MEGILLWKVPSYGRCPFMGGVLLWKVSSYEKCPLVGGVLLWKVYFAHRPLPLISTSFAFIFTVLLLPQG